MASERPPLSVALAVGVLSAAALAYEILLIRLFSIVDWHHLTFLVISLALLGYGASGTFLALFRGILLRRWAVASAIAAAAFGAASIGSFLVSQRIAFNSLEIIWSRRQAGTLFLLYLLFSIPFFCAATSIGLTLSRFGEQSPKIYRADLMGAGCSSAAITGLLFVAHPVTSLQIIGCLGFAAAALFLLPVRRSAAVILALAGMLIIAAARPILFPLRVSEFKELSQALRIPGTRLIEERSSPLALLSALESRVVPFRFAPGLSLTFVGSIPEQIGVFSDASSFSPIARQSTTIYLDFVPTAVPYHLRRLSSVAVIGAGGGSEVLSALAHGADDVTAVELNPQMVDLVARDFRAFSGELYADRRVRVVRSEARRFIAESTERYDLIQISLVDSFGASAAGVQALTASHLYTVEALTDFVRHLQPNGLLVITRWMQVPPRDIVKLFATAVVALEGLQLNPAPRMAVIRSWNTATLIVKRSPLDAGELAALRHFCDERSFDVDYAPGLMRTESNRYNVLDDSYVFDAASALLGPQSDDFFERYKFFVRPATDERPYFFHFFKWRVLPELLRLRARGGLPLIEWGYLILIAGLIQALLASLVLILLPLFRHSAPSRAEPLIRLIVYFGAIGFAFLFLEIAFIQQLTLFLGHPLYAVAVVLASFLVFAGIGSGVSERLGERWKRAIPVTVAIAALVELISLRLLLGLTLGMQPMIKVALSIALVAPLALLMGMPFPIGLKRLSRTDATAIPWAWGINGTASVLSSMCATLIAVHFGFSAVVASAALLYAIAGWSVRRAESP
jgi:spermine/spermidine synthase